MSDDAKTTAHLVCAGCGMPLLRPHEYHPHAACVLFHECQDADRVRAAMEAYRAAA